MGQARRGWAACQQRMGAQTRILRGGLGGSLGEPQWKKCAFCVWASLGRTEAREAGRGADTHGPLPWAWHALGPSVCSLHHTCSPLRGDTQALGGGIGPAASLKDCQVLPGGKRHTQSPNPRDSPHWHQTSSPVFLQCRGLLDIWTWCEWGGGSGRRAGVSSRATLLTPVWGGGRSSLPQLPLHSVRPGVGAEAPWLLSSQGAHFTEGETEAKARTWGG